MRGHSGFIVMIIRVTLRDRIPGVAAVFSAQVSAWSVFRAAVPLVHRRRSEPRTPDSEKDNMGCFCSIHAFTFCSVPPIPRLVQFGAKLALAAADPR